MKSLRTVGVCFLRSSFRVVGAFSLLAPLAAQGGLRVNGELPHGQGFAAGDVLAFELSPDGRWAVFFADPVGDDRMELFSTPVAGRAAPSKLNGPLVEGGHLVEVYYDPEYGTFFSIPNLEISAGNRVVYRGDQDTDQVFELYSAPIDGSAPAVKISGSLTAGGDVGRLFTPSPDGAKVLFVADRETDEVFELFVAPIDGSSAPVKLSGSLVAGGGFDPNSYGSAMISPDGQTVVYRVDALANEVYELFSVPLDGSADPVLLSATPVTGGDAAYGFQISPDGSRVVYRADALQDDVFELWSVPIDGGAAPTRLHAGGSFSISSDSSRVVYLASNPVDGLTHVYSVALDGGPSVLLGGPQQPGGWVSETSISPDSAWVVMRGDLEEEEVYELYSVPIDGSAIPVKLNAQLPPEADVGGPGIDTPFLISPGGRVVYLADQDAVGVKELWSVPIDAGAPHVKISGTLVSGGNVKDRFAISPDGAHVLYRADAAVDGRFDLWKTPILANAAPLRLNGALVLGGDVAAESNAQMHTGFALTSDGREVVYRADARSNELFALWSIPLDRGRRPRELSGELEAGPVVGDVLSFIWGADHLVYSADQEQDEDFSVYSAALGPLQRGGRISRTQLGSGTTMLASPDGSRVAFRGAATCTTHRTAHGWRPCGALRSTAASPHGMRAKGWGASPSPTPSTRAHPGWWSRSASVPTTSSKGSGSSPAQRRAVRPSA